MHESCPICLYPVAHPLGIYLKGERCSGCITHDEKKTLDWEQRESQLYDIINRFKTTSRTYDCIVPVVGDAEDFFVLQKILELGLRPLVVSVNDYFKNDIGWRNLHHLITFFDVDSLLYNPDLHTYKELVKASLRKFDHVLLPFLQLHTSFPVHVAKERKIPLIIWGQNQAVEQAGKFSHKDSVEMSKWSRKEHDLFGTEVSDLIGNGAQVNTRNLNYYHYPIPADLSRSKVTGIYLSNFYRWDPLRQNSSTLSLGFVPQSNNYSFDVYERAGSSVYYGIHDILKYKRVGYRKITDHIAREIRHERITTEEGKLIERSYSNNKVYIKPFFDWLGVTKSGYEWFKLHRLNQVEHLISNHNNFTDMQVRLPEKIKNMVLKSSDSGSDFMMFDKGI
jgi:N-acetyl sugar amidotransferase